MHSGQEVGNVQAGAVTDSGGCAGPRVIRLGDLTRRRS